MANPFDDGNDLNGLFNAVMDDEDRYQAAKKAKKKAKRKAKKEKAAKEAERK